MEKCFLKILEQLTFIMSSVFCAEIQTAHLQLSPSWLAPFKSTPHCTDADHLAPAGAASRHLLQTSVNFILGHKSFAYLIQRAVIHLSSVSGKGEGSKRINIHVFKRIVHKHMACSPKKVFSRSLGEKRYEVFCLFSVWFWWGKYRPGDLRPLQYCI